VTADVLKSPRRGTPSAYAHPRRRHRTRGTRHRASAMGRVLRSVLRHVHVYPSGGALWQHGVRTGGRLRRHRGWANLRKREEPAPGSSKADVARLAAHHRSARRGVVRQKRKVVEATVPARISGARVWLPARRINAVAEVVRRRLASNKLGIRAAKTAAGSSERGPSSK